MNTVKFLGVGETHRQQIEWSQGGIFFFLLFWLSTPLEAAFVNQLGTVLIDTVTLLSILMLK